MSGPHKVLALAFLCACCSSASPTSPVSSAPVSAPTPVPAPAPVPPAAADPPPPPAPAPDATPVPSDPAPVPSLPVPTPPPVLAADEYRASGRVKDENGVGVANARVWLESHGTTTLVSTGGDGSYSLSFRSQRLFLGVANVIALIYAGHNGYLSTAQAIHVDAHDFVRDLRIRRETVITAGQSVAISVDTDSPICYDGEFVLRLTTFCELVPIRAPATGTVVVTAGAPADVQSSYVGTTQSQGSVSLPVEAGRIYHIGIEVHRGYLPVQIPVTTSFK